MKNLKLVTNITHSAQEAEKLFIAECKKQNLDQTDPIVVAIGGDGTMLMAVRDHHYEYDEFVGISAGHLGFMQTISINQIPELVLALKNKTYSFITSPLLSAKSIKNGNILGEAFNDITVERSASRAAKFSLDINGSKGNFVGDGIIFATPLGSTAYSLAAGGPIIDSKIDDIFVVTPNNPHVSEQYSTLQRPHIMSKDRTIRIILDQEILQDRPLEINFDGYGIELKEDIAISLSDKKIKLIQLSPDGIHNRIEEKRLGRH